MTVMQWLQAIAAGALVYGILRVAIPSGRKRLPDAGDPLPRMVRRMAYQLAKYDEHRPLADEAMVMLMDMGYRKKPNGERHADA